MARRRVVWLLSLPFAVGAWVVAHWLMHLTAADRPEGRMLADAGQHSLGPAYACAACATMVFLLIVLLLARPAFVFGCELGQRLLVGHVPRPSAWRAPPLLPALVQADLGRPPILATNHGERAPPCPAVA
jgi:hypothetical protein